MILGNSQTRNLEIIDESYDYLAEDKQLPQEADFRVLKRDEAMELMTESVHLVSSTTGLPPKAAKELLQKFQWDSDRLVNSLYDDKNILKNKENKFKKYEIQRDEINDECGICLILKPSELVAVANCDHVFCLDCLKIYVSTKIINQGVVQGIQCPDANCNIFIDEDLMPELLTGSGAQMKCQRLIINRFVDCNVFLCWCPQAGCDNIIQAYSRETRLVKCSCDIHFCFSCRQDWHYPLECDVLKHWTSLLGWSNPWLKGVIKSCPKCGIPIEKNGGCRYVHCPCSSEFCWNCLQGPDAHKTDALQHCDNSTKRKCLQVWDAHKISHKFKPQRLLCFLYWIFNS